MSHLDTKEKILSAFNELAARGDFESITVFQIVQKAGVSRATFYRYFKDKYDVMNYNYSSRFDRHFKQGHIHTLEDLFYYLLEEGKQYWKPLLPLFRSEGVNSLYTFMRDYSYTSAKNIYEYGNIHGEGPIKRQLNKKETLQLQIFASGAAKCYENWIRGEYQLSSREAAAAMAEILPECLKEESLTF